MKAPLQQVVVSIALALGAVLSGAPGLAAAPDVINPGSVTKSGTDGVGGIEKGPSVVSVDSALTGGGTGNDPLTSPGPWIDLGQALPGQLGLPELAGVGSGLPGSLIGLLLEGGRPGAPATLIAGLQAVPSPLKGGTLVPLPQMLVSGLIVAPDGTLQLPAVLPAALPPGTTLFLQIWMPDGVGPQGFSASNCLALVVP